ncbi:hypothetical protein Q7L86_02225 [Candidatus Liberibacter asiaticus]
MNFRIAMLISFLASGCVAHALLTKKIESDTDFRREKATISLSAHDKEGSKHTMNAEFSVPKNDEKYTISACASDDKGNKSTLCVECPSPSTPGQYDLNHCAECENTTSKGLCP